MTREELVEELNKLDKVNAKIDGDVLHISGEDICDLQYEYGDLVACGQIILAENRTPEQVLSVVKGLFGQSKKFNNMNFLPEIEITNVSNQQKFICFRIKGLDDGIIVGLTHPELDLNDAKQELVIGYKGVVKKVCFKKRKTR